MRAPSNRAAVCAALATFLAGIAAAQQTAPVLQTLHTQVQLVTVDVVVTDKHGHPVRGLKIDDFTLLENKSPQAVKSFEEHTGNSDVSAPARLPRGVFGNTPVSASGAVNVLLLDGLNTPADAQPYLRNQLVKFLAGEQRGAQTAVFALNTRLNLLQDFTNDPALLKRMVEMQGVKFSPLLNRELNDSPVHSTSESYSDMIERAQSSGNAGLAAAMENLQSSLLDMNARQHTQELKTRALLTLDALSQLARFLGGIPGRKNVLWFSGSFPVQMMRDVSTTGDPFAGYADVSEQLRRTTDLLAANQVAMYPIDARGLEPPPSQLPEFGSDSGSLQRSRQVYGTRSATPRDDQFRIEQVAEQSTMDDLADGTGGEAFYNTNGLAQAIQRAVSDGENYYTLTYTPPPGSKPGKFRSIGVEVRVPGVKTAFRHGYYTPKDAASDPGASAKAISNSVADAHTPDASEIRMQMQPVLANDAPKAKTIGLNLLQDRPHTVYSLNFSVDTSGLDFQQGDDGKMHVMLEFATLLYDKGGKIVASQQDGANLALDPARYQGMVQNGLRFHHFLAIPDDAHGTVRVLVHDVATNHVGSLHLSTDQLRQAASLAP